MSFLKYTSTPLWKILVLVSSQLEVRRANIAVFDQISLIKGGCHQQPSSVTVCQSSHIACQSAGSYFMLQWTKPNPRLIWPWSSCSTLTGHTSPCSVLSVLFDLASPRMTLLPPMMVSCILCRVLGGAWLVLCLVSFLTSFPFVRLTYSFS